MYCVLVVLINVPFFAQTEIQPMVKASWSQSSPFNSNCPEINGASAAAGCGAVAISQILYYYQSPEHGFGTVSYDSVNFDFESHPIDWSNICEKYTSSNSEQEKSAVANLIFQVGAAMKMKYGTSSSPYNYPTMMWGLQHYLHFSPKSRYRNRRFYSTSEWIEMISSELEQGRPVFYRGDHTSPIDRNAGHMFVIDGRDSSGNYHVNFGHANTTQDKFVDLNIINQWQGEKLGFDGVCYHHSQAMVTDFYPVRNATDEDFDKTAIVLNSPLVLDNDPQAQTVVAEKSVHAMFQFRYVNFIEGDAQFSLGFYQGGELKGVSKTVRPVSISHGGWAVNVGRNFLLPDNLPNGDYELSIVSRDNDSSSWVRGWDNAPNRIPVKVCDNTYTFHLPNYHRLECRLFLDDKISEMDSENQENKIFEFSVSNLSENNFEDSLRLCITSSLDSLSFIMPTSIYEGQHVTYRFSVGKQLIKSKKYQVDAYYRETNSGEWILLQDYTSDILIKETEHFDGLRIYSINGILMKSLKRTDIDDSYLEVLSQLPKGIFIIQEKNKTRKFIKR